MVELGNIKHRDEVLFVAEWGGRGVTKGIINKQQRAKKYICLTNLAEIFARHFTNPW
jgi:hypothetical protein